MKRNRLSTLLSLLLIGASAMAQITVSWGTIDKRYPVEVTAEIKPVKNPVLTAWKGERVNMQLVVANTGAEQEISIKFDDLTDNNGNIISAANIKGGIVEPVIADTFTGCSNHAVDAHGAYLTADRITMTETTQIA